MTVVGGGVIGASWAALFLANGLRVTINDPAPDVIERVHTYCEDAMPSLLALGYADFDVNDIIFEPDLAKALAGADYVQENGPERLDFKIALWKSIEKHAPQTALLLSSSSGIGATKQSAQLANPGRLIIGHPFNPPHLMPLIEVVPGEQTPPEVTVKAIEFYEAIGKTALEIKQEIPGFVANRLQSAIFRECMYLVKKGVVTIRDLDQVVTSSLGIRWATGGPFLSFHLGGGDGGFSHFVNHLGPGMAMRWKDQMATDVQFDEDTKTLLLDQIQDAYGDSSIAVLNAERDAKEVAVINGLAGLANASTP